MSVGLLMPVPGLYMKNQSKMRYVYSLLIVGGATLLARLLLPHFAPTNLVMIYLLAVVLISAKLGRGPAVVASLASVCIFDFFCIEPFLTFAVSDSQYLFTFGVMLTTNTVSVDIKAKSINTLPAVSVVAALAGLLAGMIWTSDWFMSKNMNELAEQTTSKEIGSALITTHLLPFEVASVVLLVAIVGAAMMARREGVKSQISNTK